MAGVWLASAAALVMACGDVPSVGSAQCVGHDDCGACGRCDKGVCFEDDEGFARETCLDERKDPCNGVDDDDNGVIDDPPSCWVWIWELAAPSGAGRCLTSDPTNPPAACAGYLPLSAEPAFSVPATAVPGTVAMRQCSLGSDHVLVAEGARGAGPSGVAAPEQPVAAWEALGYVCGAVIGHFYVDAPDYGGAEAPVGEVCPLRRFVSSPSADAPLGVRRYVLGAPEASVEGACDPRETLRVLSPRECDAAPVEGCELAACPPVARAALVARAIADHQVVEPGASFVQTWEIENTGEVAWGGDWAFVRTAAGGSAVDRVELGEQVAVGERALLEVAITAPAHGIDVVERWALRTAEGVTVPIGGVALNALTLEYDVATPHAGHLVALDPPFKVELPPGTEFVQEITLQNAGDTIWAEGWRLVRTAGAMSQITEVAMPAVAPGEVHTVSIPMRTVAAVFGGFNERWQLRDGDERVVPIDGAATVWARVHAIADDEAMYLSGLVDDGTAFAPGTTFIQSWRFRNNGRTTWGEGWSFRRNAGELAVWPSVPVTAPVAPGGELVVTVPVALPVSGGASWRDTWEVVNADGTIVPVTAESPPGNKVIGAGPSWWFWVDARAATPCAPAVTVAR